MNTHGNEAVFNSSRRKHVFLEMARRPEGAAPPEVHQSATSQGDSVTEETYYNIARILHQRGLLRKDDSVRPTRYYTNQVIEEKWLDEDDLLSMLDPDYPLLALTIANEASRQVNEVSEEIWFELCERLRSESARGLFKDSICAYCDIFAAQVGILADSVVAASSERTRLDQEAENTRQLLLQLTKYGLGLSKEAVDLPANLGDAITRHKAQPTGIVIVNDGLLSAELARRVADEAFVVNVCEAKSAKKFVIGGVDGSTRGGVLSFLGEDGDFVAGHAPLISINTSVGQLNQLGRQGDREFAVFLRLPEKPEDMQRSDNRFTVMAKMLHPDMSDAQYMHSVWNAMDMVEAKVTLRLLKRWETGKPSFEVPAADVVLRDGTVSPQDRDFAHYCDLSTYGKIVRELIETNWEIALKCRENGHTVAGVVKTTQLLVYGPVLNWYAAQLGLKGVGQIAAWPIQEMNLIPDQILLTRLLTAKRKQKDAWSRSCVVVRPFHSVTNFAKGYRRKNTPPSAPILEAHRSATATEDVLNEDRRHFWEQLFRGVNDAFVKMLDHVGYASFFVGAVPRLDIEKRLPRIEFLVIGSNIETDDVCWKDLTTHRDRLLAAIQQNGFDVSAEHTMFDNPAKLDILPSILVQVHDTVKHWAADLLSRVQEYIGAHISRFIKNKQVRGVKVRPLKREELRLLYESMKRERDLLAGDSDGQNSLKP